MKLNRLFPVFVFGLGLILALALLMTPSPAPEVAHAWPITPAVTPSPPITRPPGPAFVAPGGTGSWCLQNDPCGSIQYAVDECEPGNGDTIYVATGSYTGVQTRNGITQSVYLTKTVTIRGGFAPDFSSWDPEAYPTVLDAQRQGRVFYIVGDGSPVIEGLHIINGDAEAGDGSGYGGGILAVGGSGPSLTVTLRYNHVISNYATTVSPGGGGHGGGLSFIFSNAILEKNLIEHNVTDGSGGGLRLEQTNAWLRDNIIRHNQAIGTNTGAGGGIYMTNLASARITNTVIADNEVSYGGAGMVVAGAYARMVHTTLARNHGGDGSGIYVVIGGIHSTGNVSMTNSIVVSHTVGITVAPGHIMIGDNHALLDGVLWYDNGQNTGGGGVITVTHEYTGAPAFSTDGYHLGPGSAAIDAGVNAGVLTDIDGDPRPFGPAPDLGADESTCLARVGGVDYTVIQDAIDTATSSQTVQVAAGTCYENLRITKTVTLEGGWNVNFSTRNPDPASVSTIDGMGAGRVISITETSGSIAPRIDGFTITGGDASGLGGDPPANDAGGGIYSQDAAPIIVHNIITGNYGCVGLGCTNYGRGGGIYLLNAPATAVISDNLIANNVADESTWGQGGGIMLRDSDAQVFSNTIEYNRAGHSAGYGGGITVKDGRPTIADNDILHNVAGQGVQGLGGGIFVWSTTPATIERNLIAYNQAINGPGDPVLTSRGGGICYLGNPTVSAVVRDNILRYNLASPLAPQHGEGGGMYLSGLVSPSLVSGNTLEYNVAGFNDDGNGGGIYVDDSEVSITDNHVFDNSATWSGSHGEGGGLYVNGGAVLIQGNTITNNLAATFSGGTRTGYGGGMVISGSLAIVQDNWIVGNRGTNAPSLSAGGGIYVYSGTLQIAGNTIAENRASAGDNGFGGGIYLGETRSWLEANTIVDNVAADGSNGRGGGVRIGICPIFTMTNNIVARNDASARGSGIAIAYSDGRLAHNTIAENLAGDGIGVRVDFASSGVVLYNNIIASHTVGISNTNPGGSTVGAKYTLFEGNGTNYGAGVNSTYEILGPALLQPNYHLGPGSGAIDQAVTLYWVTTDIDGDSRPIGPAPDVGADEARLRVYLPLVLRNS